MYSSSFNTVGSALIFICISDKEVSIKKSLNYLGVSSRQYESTMKVQLCCVLAIMTWGLLGVLSVFWERHVGSDL